MRQRYGLPLDSRHLQAKTDWEFFAAAVTRKSVRQEILQSVALWINETTTGMPLLFSSEMQNSAAMANASRNSFCESDRPLTDLHETEGTGGFPATRFMARPVIGGHFAFLSLERACGGNALAGLEFLDVEESNEDLGYREL